MPASAGFIKCRACGRTVSGYIPKQGDGAMGFPFKHTDPKGNDCNGRYQLAEWDNDYDPATDKTSAMEPTP